jgi:hypothetical protein
VATQRYNGVFPPDDTFIEGDICYHFQPADTFMRIYIQLDGTQRSCNADHLSPFIDVCSPNPTCTGLFPDVAPDNPFYSEVMGLTEVAVSGYADGTFRPFNNVTRGQVAKMVVLAADLALRTTDDPASSGQSFSDVPADHPFFEFVQAAHAKGLISGYADGTFRPYNNVTRGQVAKIMVQAAGWTPVNPATPTFSDVSVGSTFYTYIETAYANGILSGYPDGTFRPQADATRGQIAKIIVRALTPQQEINPRMVP